VTKGIFMKINRILKRIIFVITMGSLILLGCSQPNQVVKTAELPKDKTPASENVAATTTGTLLLEMPTSTQISLEPSPTFSPQSREEEVSRLMQTNSNCGGVCFWGIIPGSTKFEEAIQFLQNRENSSTRQVVDSISYYFSTISYKGNSVLVNLSLSETNGVVKNINARINGIHSEDVTGQDWLAFRPDHFLLSNGNPKHVYIVMSEGPEGRISYRMIWLYDEIYIQYVGNQTIIKPDHVLRACPLKDQSIQSVDLRMGPLDEIADPDGVDLFQITALTKDSFYETLTSDPDVACFDLDFYKITPPN